MSITRAEFQNWLDSPYDNVLTVRQNTSMAIIFKIPREQEIEYLFGVKPFYGDRINWEDTFYFCGLYNKQTHALYYAYGPVTAAVDGLTEQETRKSSEICEAMTEAVNQYIEQVIGNDWKNLDIKELHEEDNILEYLAWCNTHAKNEAEKRFFYERPAIRFEAWYCKHWLNERDMIAYAKDPELYIRTEGDRFIQDNQEEILLQLMKNELVQAEYQAILQDPSNPVHRKLEIKKAAEKAIEQSGAETVTVAVQKGDKTRSFRVFSKSLKSLCNRYFTFDILPKDRRKLDQKFSKSLNFSVMDIVRITCDQETLYTAPSEPLRKDLIDAMRDAADPSLPHQYGWFVTTDINTPEMCSSSDLTLEEAIRQYQESSCANKRLGVTKDGITTMDIAVTINGKEEPFVDYLTPDSFKDDPVVASAVETIHQKLEQCAFVQRMNY